MPSSLLAMAKVLHQTRLRISEGKTRCRDHIRAVLNEAQWQKLKAMIAQMCSASCIAIKPD